MMNSRVVTFVLATAGLALVRVDARPARQPPHAAQPLPLAIEPRAAASSVALNAPPAQTPVPLAPPADRTETAPTAPDASAVWVPGSWVWVTGRFFWLRGQWDHAPVANAVWVPAQWAHAGVQNFRRDGYWRAGARVFVVPLPPIPIAPESTTEGTLETGDLSLGDAGVADEYAIDLVAEQPVQLVAWPRAGADGSGAELALSVRTTGDEIASDEPGAGSGEREIEFTPKRAGVYIVRVATQRTDSPQRYDLYVSPQSVPATTPTNR